MTWGHKPSNFIQWKGTDVCMDVLCLCGGTYHVDQQDFLYVLFCNACGRFWKLGTEVTMTEIPPPLPKTTCVYDLKGGDFVD